MRIGPSFEGTESRLERQKLVVDVSFDLPIAPVDGFDGSHGVPGLGVVDKGKV